MNTAKPDDIPQAVWERASEVVCDEGVYAKGASHLILIERVARAIMRKVNNPPPPSTPS